MLVKMRPFLSLMLLAMATIIARPAAAVQAPDKAVPEQTMLVVWLDLEQIDAETIESVGETISGFLAGDRVQDLGLGVPLGDPEEGIAKMAQTRDAMVENGAEGLLLMIDRPADDSWSPAMRALVKTSADADAEKLAELASGLSDEGDLSALAAPYADGWHSLAIWRDGDEEQDIVLPAVTDGDEEVAAQFNLQLEEQGDAPFTLVFRMDETMKKRVDDMTAGGQQQNPQMAMMMSMAGMLRGMDSLAVSLADEEGLNINIAMRFEDTEQATAFVQMYNALMMMAPALVAQQAQNMPDPPEPAMINSFFAKLMMKPDGQTLRMELDPSFFEMAQQLSSLFEGMGIQPENFNLDL